MPDATLHPSKGGFRHVITQPLYHLGINLFTAIEFLQGITGLGIQILCHAVLYCRQGIRQFIQPQIPLIDHIDFRGHAVDAKDQNYRHRKHHQIYQNKNAAHLRLKRQLSKFLCHTPPHSASSCLPKYSSTLL